MITRLRPPPEAGMEPTTIERPPAASRLTTIRWAEVRCAHPRTAARLLCTTQHTHTHTHVALERKVLNTPSPTECVPHALLRLRARRSELTNLHTRTARMHAALHPHVLSPPALCCIGFDFPWAGTYYTPSPQLTTGISTLLGSCKPSPSPFLPTPPQTQDALALLVLDEVVHCDHPATGYTEEWEEPQEQQQGPQEAAAGAEAAGPGEAAGAAGAAGTGAVGAGAGGRPARSVVVHFRGQPSVRARLVVGADGIFSAIRAAMHPGEPPPR